MWLYAAIVCYDNPTFYEVPTKPKIPLRRVNGKNNNNTTTVNEHPKDDKGLLGRSKWERQDEVNDKARGTLFCASW